MLDSAPTIQHYPLPMMRYGLNPFGENLYRIVLASTVARLVGGEWPDGTRCYRWSVPLSYRSKGWVLETWDWCRVPKPEWESLRDPVSGWPVRGPYPSRGEYYLSWEFDRGVLSDNLDTIIGAIERGRNRSFEDIRAAHKAEYEAEEKEFRSNRDAEIRDSFTAFGVTPKPISSLNGVFRGTKTLPELRSAQALGLPIPGTRPSDSRRISGRRTFDMRDAQVTSTLLSGV